MDRRLKGTGQGGEGIVWTGQSGEGINWDETGRKGGLIGTGYGGEMINLVLWTRQGEEGINLDETGKTEDKSGRDRAKRELTWKTGRRGEA